MCPADGDDAGVEEEEDGHQGNGHLDRFAEAQQEHPAEDQQQRHRQRDLMSVQRGWEECRGG